jgi:tRNA(Ile)-lysidine synthase
VWPTAAAAAKFKWQSTRNPGVLGASDLPVKQTKARYGLYGSRIGAYTAAVTDLYHALLPTLRALFTAGDRVGVATSGGPDSQVLLDLLARSQTVLQLGTLVAVGVDHGLRPAAAAELDQAEALACHHGVPFVRLQVSVQRLGNRLAAARSARYTALHTFAQAHRLNTLAVGHTATDQVETMLQRLIRGCGLKGVGSMRFRRAAVVRPLLQVGRAQVLGHVAACGLSVAHDPSNANLRTSRARLRHRVLPQLQRINPQFEKAFCQFAQQAQQDDDYLQARARRLLARAVRCWGMALDLERLTGAHPSLGGRALQAWLRAQGVPQPSRRLQTQICAWRSVATQQHSEAGVNFWQERGMLWALPAMGPQGPWPACALEVPTVLHFPGHPWRLRAHQRQNGTTDAAQFDSLGSESVAFDADRLHFGLTVRPWQTGDRLRPFGLNGHINVGDLFTNAKVPRALRGSWPIVTHGEQVAWVVGLRRSDVAPVAAHTARIIHLQMEL